MSDLISFVEELEPTSEFEFRLSDRIFKFRNLSGFSEGKNFADNAKTFAKGAREAAFQKKLVELLPADFEDVKKKSIVDFLKTRQIDDWELAYKIENLSTSPKIGTLEAIMLTKVQPFVEIFNLQVLLNQSKGMAETFAKLVAAEKKDSKRTGSGNSDSKPPSRTSKSTRTTSGQKKNTNSSTQ